MLSGLLQYNDVGLLLLRVAIAAIFLYHGLPKLKGKMGTAFLVLGVVESLAAIGLLLGIYIQLSALLLAIVMVGAIYMKVTKWQTPFSAMDKMGWEFDLILIAGNVAILLGGGGSIGLF